MNPKILVTLLATFGLARGEHTPERGVSPFRQREGRLSTVNVVKFQNEGCMTTTGKAGVCYTEGECMAKGGTVEGNCAQGFGTCCYLTHMTCGGEVRNNCTHVQNPGYPLGSRKAQTCTYKIPKLDNSICFVRLDFIEFEIFGAFSDGFNKGNCNLDTIDFVSGNGRQKPQLCGILTGQHMYLEPGMGGTESSFTTKLVTDLPVRKYNIKVSQIPCGASYAPPSHCEMFLMGMSGLVKSYNFDGRPGFHLNNMNYNICFRQEARMCKIGYTATDELNSFRWSTKTRFTMGRNGQNRCRQDYIVIPRGHNGDNDCVTSTKHVDGNVGGQNAHILIKTETVDRYCARRLNCVQKATSNSNIISDVKPFKIRVVTNEEETNTPNQDFGLSFVYRQIPC